MNLLAKAGAGGAHGKASAAAPARNKRHEDKAGGCIIFVGLHTGGVELPMNPSGSDVLNGSFSLWICDENELDGNAAGVSTLANLTPLRSGAPLIKEIIGRQSGVQLAAVPTLIRFESETPVGQAHLQEVFKEFGDVMNRPNPRCALYVLGTSTRGPKELHANPAEDLYTIFIPQWFAKPMSRFVSQPTFRLPKHQHRFTDGILRCIKQHMVAVVSTILNDTNGNTMITDAIGRAEKKAAHNHKLTLAPTDQPGTWRAPYSSGWMEGNITIPKVKCVPVKMVDTTPEEWTIAAPNAELCDQLRGMLTGSPLLRDRCQIVTLAEMTLAPAAAAQQQGVAEL
eukprot:g20087.t1